MTAERLATLRAIRLFRGRITYPELAVHLRLNEGAALERLERMKDVALLHKEGKGKTSSYVMTNKGWGTLRYAEEHLVEGIEDGV
jgi:RIO-like serine/threonine protein kinase